MSSIEYIDLFIKAQNNMDANFHMFTFDIVGSKNLSTEELLEAEGLLQKIIIETYNIIYKKEQIDNKKILVYDKDFVRNDNIVTFIPHEFGLKIEPFKLGDMVGFTIYKNSLSKEDVITIFDTVKEKYNYKYELHYANGYYETNNYIEGNTKLFRGYCIDILSNEHKKIYVKKRKTVSN